MIHRGKVRDCLLTENLIIVQTTDRLSAFDKQVGMVPDKGKILNELSLYWLNQTQNLVPNYYIKSLDDRTIMGQRVKVFPIEFVVRDYITGSAWRAYEEGTAVWEFPKNLIKNQKLPELTVTPTTKAEKDEPITFEEILEQGIMTEEQLEQVIIYSCLLFTAASGSVKDLILVDTKFEFGVNENGEILLVDEVLTMDSSRWWVKESYPDLFSQGLEPEMLDKENVRRWLMEQGFMGEGTPPEIPENELMSLRAKYIKAYEMITGQPSKW